MPTLREIPAEAESTSHMLMLKAGLIRKLASGIYAFLPLGLRVLRKIEDIIREEMDKAGAQEVLMPALLPADFFKETGRWDVFGQEMFRLEDRSGREFCLGPTHEEIFTMLAGHEIRSYRELPKILYQIQSKFRDEIRPRFGVIRSREFIMKDAYSFDMDAEGLDKSYKSMYEAYCRIFNRCGLDCIAVNADSGAMGGSGSQEFMVRSEIGEAVIAYCEACGYAASDEKAECKPAPWDGSNTAEADRNKPMRLVETPDSRTIEDLTKFFNCSPCNFAKTLLYKADDRVVAAMVRGDRELNEAKLRNHLCCTELAMADAETVVRTTGADVGFAGPVGLDSKVELIMDNEVEIMGNIIVGANRTGFHYCDVVPHRDFQPAAVIDLRRVTENDPCPCCGGALILTHGIETGHVFKLGTKYSSRMGCTYPDETGKEQPMVMGCYGIGVNRTMAAVIEQHKDENGILWPAAIAPYHVMITLVNPADPVQAAIAEKLYEDLAAAGVEVLLDDRDERAGVKFKDADLIGIPVRITVGKRAGEGIVEYKERQMPAKEDLSLSDAVVKARDSVLGG